MKRNLSCTLFVMICTSVGIVMADADLDRAVQSLEGFRKNCSSLNIDRETLQIMEDVYNQLKQMKIEDSGRSAKAIDMDKMFQAQLRTIERMQKSRATVFLSSDEKQQLAQVSRWLRIRKSAGNSSSFHPAPSFLSAVNTNRQVDRQWQLIAPTAIKKGDVVLRHEPGFLSWRITQASRDDKRFTHVAVVVTDAPDPEIVGISLGPTPTGIGMVSKMSWRTFFKNSDDGAVYRLKADEGTRTKIAECAKNSLGVPFDPSFDIATKDELYCSEMVRDAVNAAVGREVIGTSRKGDFEYVAIDDCYRNGFVKIFDAKEWKPSKQESVSSTLSGTPQAKKADATTPNKTSRLRIVPMYPTRRCRP